MLNNDNESKYVPDKKEPEIPNFVTSIEASYSDNNISEKIEVSKEISPILVEQPVANTSQNETMVIEKKTESLPKPIEIIQSAVLKPKNVEIKEPEQTIQKTNTKEKQPTVQQSPMKNAPKNNPKNNQSNANNNNNRNQLQYPWSHDNKAVSIMKNWYPLRFKLNYPKNSVLSAYEQKDYLNLHSKFRNRTHVNEKEVKFYKLYSVNIILVSELFI